MANALERETFDIKIKMKLIISEYFQHNYKISHVSIKIFLFADKVNLFFS